MSQTFQQGDIVDIKACVSGRAWPIYGTVGRTQEFLGETCYYVLSEDNPPGMLCHPSLLRLVGRR